MNINSNGNSHASEIHEVTDMVNWLGFLAAIVVLATGAIKNRSSKK